MKDKLKQVKLCNQCVRDKKDCPYPAAYNSFELGHIACDEAFTETRRVTGAPRRNSGA